MASSLIISNGVRKPGEKFNKFQQKRRELNLILSGYLSGRTVEGTGSDTSRKLRRNNKRKPHHNYFTRKYKGRQARALGAKLAGLDIKTHDKKEKKEYGFAKRFRNRIRATVRQ